MRKRWLLLVGLLASVMLSGAMMFQFLSGFQPVAAQPAESQTAVASNRAPTEFPILADFENGVPAGFFVYNGGGSSVTAVTQDIPAGDPLALPNQTVTNTVLSTTFSVGDYGGFGADFSPNPQDWSGYDGFSFWFYGTNSGLSYQAEIMDNRSDPNSDTAERFDHNFTDDFVGWRHIIIPFSSFNRATDYQPAGAPNDGLTLTEMWGFAFPLPQGSSGFYVDRVALVSFHTLADFETDFPAGYFVYNGGGSSVSTVLQDIPAGDPLALPNQTVTNTVLSTTFNVGDYGGFGADFAPNPQDWSGEDGFSFWFYGSNSGLSYQAEIMDNRSDPNSDTAERFDHNFTDDFTGWRLISIPFTAFNRATDYQPAGAPNDGLTLTEMWGFAFPLPQGSSGIYVDGINLFGTTSNATLSVAFDSSAYTVVEGGTAVITASLNMTSATPVTVTYQTSDGTATAGADYTATTGTLVFPPHTWVQTFTVATADDATLESNETVALSLTDPQGAVLGARDTSTLTIHDNETPSCQDPVLVDGFENGQLPQALDPNGIGIGYVTWHDPNSSVSITTTDVISAIPGLPITNTVLQRDSNIVSYAGFSHAFTNPAVTTWVSHDWSHYEGVCFWVYGTDNGSTQFIDFMDNRNPNSTTDDAERWSYSFVDNFVGWQAFTVPFTDFQRKEIGNGAPNDGRTLTEVWGWAYGSLTSGGPQTHYIDQFSVYGHATPTSSLKVAFAQPEFGADEGATAVITVSLNMTSDLPVTVTYRTAETTGTAGRDYTPVSGTLVFPANSLWQTFTVSTLPDSKYEGNEDVMLRLSNPQNADLGLRNYVPFTVVENDPLDPALLNDFEGYHGLEISGTATLSITEIAANSALARPGQDPYENVLTVGSDGTASGLRHVYPTSQDWSGYEGLSFWAYGTNSGQTISVTLLDNQITTTEDVAPADWQLVWSDEFNTPAGTPPDPNAWTHDIGDGTLSSIAGWGNGELEFYTDSTDNAATDGKGRLVITAHALDTANSDLQCWYGPCAYSSARLLSPHKVEAQYGRIEARIRVPYGQGIWPAFWTLGNNIGDVPWPGSGELDIMENIGREPDTVHGTIHGPGYSGCCGIGGSYALPNGNLSDDFHVFAVEWEPEQIRWFIDDTNYFTATIDDIPNGTNWVFDHPFFILLNVAVGGNWPGNPDNSSVFPQTMEVDYVRVYQAVNSSERFETSYVDDFTGWRKIVRPFSDFTRSANQPVGAPNDGLGLTEVWGYGFDLPAGAPFTTHLDRLHLELDTNLLYELYLPLILHP